MVLLVQSIVLDSSSAQVSSNCCPIKMLNDEVYRLQGKENTEDVKMIVFIRRMEMLKTNTALL